MGSDGTQIQPRVASLLSAIVSRAKTPATGCRPFGGASVGIRMARAGLDVIRVYRLNGDRYDRPMGLLISLRSLTLPAPAPYSRLRQPHREAAGRPRPHRGEKNRSVTPPVGARRQACGIPQPHE